MTHFPDEGWGVVDIMVLVNGRLRRRGWDLERGLGSTHEAAR